MSRKIIIDGVNVAECDYFVRQRGFNCYMGKNCNETNDCYFKQLQRLKQENEEVLKQLEFVRTNRSVIDAERIKFKQTLEEIREMFRECCYNANFMNNCSEKCKFYKSCNGELSAIRDKINEVLND